MRIEWHIDPEDARCIRDLVRLQGERSFVRNRIRKNVNGPVPEFTRDRFWHGMMACLLTTQQRSGPGSAVTRFISTTPFLLRLSACSAQNDVASFVAEIITQFGRLRRANKIGAAAHENLAWLRRGGWTEIQDLAAALLECRCRGPRDADTSVERAAARVVMAKMREFGPKQSRNLWQCLGLTRFEIPIDSRITKWLNSNGFPVRLSAAPLADPDYYEFVMDGVQELCRACDVLPCVLDAAIFASYDQEWPESEWIW